MEVTYLDPSGSQIGKKESIADTARVLGRMFDGIEYRGYGQSIVEELAHYAGVPVWNGLTNEFHPTQILADFLTIREHFGRLKGINFVYFGDARYNMGNSLMVGCAKMGLNFTACAPKKYQRTPRWWSSAGPSPPRRVRPSPSRKTPPRPQRAQTSSTPTSGCPWASRSRVWARAHQRPGRISDQPGPDGHCRPQGRVHALPARLPRPQDHCGREMGERFGRDAMEVTDEVFEGPRASSSTRPRTGCTPSRLSWRPRWATTADGGGHVSRPDFGMPQPDPAHPLTEFYCLLQRALDREGVFALPALYAQFRAPARRIYADEAADFLTLLPDEEEGASRLLAPAQLQLLYSSLHVMPDGAPAALLLTEECTRTVYAVQLLPPFVWEDPLPPLPDAPAALSLTLTMRDVEEIDACPAALGHRLACDKAGKRWLHHPRAETYLSERVALFQRLYR